MGYIPVNVLRAIGARDKFPIPFRELFYLHDKSAHYVYTRSISVWLSVTILLTTLKTLSVSALTGKQICTLSSSGEVLVFGSG